MAVSNPNTTSHLTTARQSSLNPTGVEIDKQRDLCRVIRRGKYGGYREDILIENLTKRETPLLICEICKGIMRDACISSSGEQFCSSTEQTNSTCPSKVYKVFI